MIKILVIEDDPSVRLNLQELLAAENFDVSTAENGNHALEVLEDFYPDLIICDVMMPGMTGHELLDTISKSIKFASIPFIFLTAKADPVDYRKGMNLGADDYLTKPFTRDQILTVINARLQRSGKVAEKFEEDFDELRTNIAVSLPHELRTPLTGIMGFAEYLLDNLDTTDKDELREYISYIYSSGKRLNRLVENYIAYTELQLRRFDKGPGKKLMTRTISLLEFLVQVSQNIAYEYERGDDLVLDVEDVNFTGAEKNIEKICSEIIDNAMRFSRAGQKVIIKGKQSGDKIVIVVKDHGFGMDPASLKKLGGFVQVDRIKHEQQGAGLGLAVARQMTELCNGTFEIESKERFGTTVTITLPVEFK